MGIFPGINTKLVIKNQIPSQVGILHVREFYSR
jgi:hypothetical protein